ncbi:hypothetical protein ACFPIJ_12140 [Dactylosporangium cerinum]|uniref:Uncharacterized protein n=1 Tax=Dactylosporangium cerinum TaxID=1434730 RepID=A0ABV9VT37_9ACTN
MSMVVDLRLGIDLASARVRAVVGFQDGTAVALPLDGVGWLVNAVLVDGDGSLLVGVAAEQRAAGVASAGWVVEPGSRLGSEVLVEGRRVEAVDLVEVLLREVGSCAAAVAGAVPESVAVAVPAGWPARRLTALRVAARAAGLRGVEVVTAPVAVAWHLLCGAAVLPYGSTLLVCEVDTACTATALRRTVSGFDVLSCVDTATVVAGLGTPDAATRSSGRSVDVPSGPAGLAAVPGPGQVADGASPRIGRDGDSPPAAAWIGEVARRAVHGSGAAASNLTLVCAVGAGASDVSVGTELHGAVDVEPFLVAEADLAVALGALRSPRPTSRPTSRAVTRPVSGSVVSSTSGTRDAPVVEAGWRDVAAAAVPAMWSVVLFWQFMAGSERYGPRQSIDRAMLLAAWGGLAFAAVFGLIAVVGGLVLVTSLRHEESAAPAWVRHRLLAVALAGGGVGGLVVAAVYATVAAGYFDLESGPLLRWSVLPVLPGVVAVVGLAVVVWRRPDPPRGSWLGSLRFPPLVAALVGFGAWLISWDEQGSPVALNVLAAVLRQWVAESPTDIIGPVGRLGGLCVGVGVGLLLVRRALHRLLLAVPLAGLIAGSLGWHTTGMVAVGFAFAAAGWWAAQAVWLLLRRLLLVPPAGASVPFGAGPAAAVGGGPGWSSPSVVPQHRDVDGSRWVG